LGTQDRRRRQKNKNKNKNKNPTIFVGNHHTQDTRRRQTKNSPHEAFLEQPLLGTVKIKRFENQIIDHFIFYCHGIVDRGVKVIHF